MKESTKKELIAIVIAIIVATILSGIGYIAIKLSLNHWAENQKSVVNYVNGFTHIYKGQTLSPENYPNAIIKLSRRASYLHESEYLSLPAAVAIETMIKDAEQDGMCLVVMSGYRSAKSQEKLYEETGDKSKVALPGQSEHQTGLAVDFGGCPMKNGVRNDSVERHELVNDFSTLPEYKWLQDNASKYGFEQSFTASNTAETGYANEPWHFKLILH
jgi:D-alanyl-D-alanine carboxypeptidase